MATQNEQKLVYQLLKDRKLHPKGEFDKGGRFYLQYGELVNVRTPSRAYPYSQMAAGRTLKFVKALCAEYKIATLQELVSYFEKDKSFKDSDLTAI